jgi:hypothetical protein
MLNLYIHIFMQKSITDHVLCFLNFVYHIILFYEINHFSIFSQHVHILLDNASSNGKTVPHYP